MAFSQRPEQAGPRNGLAWTCMMLLACLAALFATAIGVPRGLTRASAEAAPNIQEYLGYWNYDQPNLTTLNNVAVLACPGGGGQCDPQLPLPLKIPQVGWVLFSPGPDGTVNGHTDQGCTWNFTVTPAGLELSSTTQQCFNHDIGSSYNITKWSVTVTRNTEHEQIVSTSFQPNGVTLIDTMNSGSRTRVARSGGPGSLSRFLGSYTYNPADFHTLTNVVLTSNGTAYPQQGTVTFTRKNHNTILAHTPDDCTWTLAVRGNTAELNPATQTCHLANGRTSLRYWAIVTDDGEHINTFRAGSTTLNAQQPTDNYLFIGALTRPDPGAGVTFTNGKLIERPTGAAA
jgi:hypothetical protein